jgi:hypothetical protein
VAGSPTFLSCTSRRILYNNRRAGMKLVGKVESLWRYPVKSMRREELPEAFVGFQLGRAERFPLSDREAAGSDAALSPGL